MDYVKIKAFALKYGCSEKVAAYYYEAALAWCGLA